MTVNSYTSEILGIPQLRSLGEANRQEVARKLEILEKNIALLKNSANKDKIKTLLKDIRALYQRTDGAISPGSSAWDLQQEMAQSYQD